MHHSMRSSSGIRTSPPGSEMAGHLRAVLDTNVLLAASHSSHPASPNVEILARWRRRKLVFPLFLPRLAS